MKCRICGKNENYPCDILYGEEDEPCLGIILKYDGICSECANELTEKAQDWCADMACKTKK